jgi:hypothetical protein
VSTVEVPTHIEERRSWQAPMPHNRRRCGVDATQHVWKWYRFSSLHVAPV